MVEHRIEELVELESPVDDLGDNVHLRSLSTVGCQTPLALRQHLLTGSQGTAEPSRIRLRMIRLPPS